MPPGCRTVTITGGGYSNADVGYLTDFDYLHQKPSATTYNPSGYEAVFQSGFPTTVPVTRSFTATTYQLCAACMYYQEGCTGTFDTTSTICAKHYFAQSGSMTVSASARSTTAGTFSGTTSTVKLVRYDFASDTVTDATDCVQINSSSFSGTWP